MDWEDETAVAAAVERFLGRVAPVPVHDDIWDVDLEVVEWRLYEIPSSLWGMIFGMIVGRSQGASSYLLHMRYSRHDEDRSYCGTV